MPKEAGKLTRPQCKTKAKPSMNCGFYHAKYTFTGTTREGEEKTISGSASGEKFYTFREEEDDTINWTYLEVVVERLD